MTVVYEDNHLLIVNKAPGELVQGDKSGDRPLVDVIKEWLKEKYSKPGNVFLGVVHRLDRPVGGLVIFAKTSKALARLNSMLREKKIRKIYRAIVRNAPVEPEGELRHFLKSVEKNNKTYVYDSPVEDAKESILRYKTISRGENYTMLEVELLTGRKHQIRAQLAAMGCPIKGDLKYGDKRSNPDGSISLIAKELSFVHPVSSEPVHVSVDCPDDTLWKALWK